MNRLSTSNQFLKRLPDSIVRWATICILATAIFSMALSARSAKGMLGDTTPGQAGGDSPTVVNKSDGSALRLAVINAVFNYVNNSRMATFDLEWDLLPESDALTQIAFTAEPLHYTLDNTVLMKDATEKNTNNFSNWVDSLKINERNALAHALGVDSVTDIRQLSPKDNYLPKLFPSDSGLSSDEATTGQLDHLALRLLLQSSGIRYVVTVPDAQVQGPQTRVYDNEISWEISLYPITRGNVTLYRATILAKLKRPQTLVFPNTTQTSATLQMVAMLKQSPAVIGLSPDIGRASGSINLPKNDQLSGVDALAGGSAIEGILKFVGNTSLQDVANNNLLRGTNRASLYYGGLVGYGEVKQVVGVNQSIGAAQGGSGADYGFGALVGIAPDRNNALFIGPSLRTNVFTLGVGLLSVEHDKPDGSKKIGTSGALTVAFDVSRLVGGKKDVQAIRLENSVIGGRSSDAVAKDTFAFNVAVEVDPALTSADKESLIGKYIQIKRTAQFASTEGGTDVPVSNTKDATVVAVPVPTLGVVRFAPRGKYVITRGNLPTAFAIFPKIGGQISQNEVATEATQVAFPIGGPGNELPVSQVYVIKKK